MLQYCGQGMANAITQAIVFVTLDLLARIAAGVTTIITTILHVHVC